MSIDIQKAKRENEITRVIGRYLTLTRKGSKFTGLCPFHDDKTPSLTVDPAKQTFKCFACGEQGDVIGFVQKIEKCTFPEAVRKLGGTPDEEKAVMAKAPAGVKAKQENPKVTVPDHTNMLGMLMPYIPARPALTNAYLDFEVGLAPHLVPADWKYLAGRLVFPIRDMHGTLVGFSGRLQGEADKQQPKYLNTPASQGYNRNGVLYGLHRAKNAIRTCGRVIITEGYKDCIALHAAGITNSVAVCGTELSASQAGLIRLVADEAVLLLDGDAAGKRAAAKMKEQLEEAGLRVFIAGLPDGEDPDSLFIRLGETGFRRVVKDLCEFAPPLECLLLTACILFPNVTIHVKDDFFSLPELVYAVLENEEFYLSKRIHTDLLEQCATEYMVGEWPLELQEEARRLLDDYREGIYAIREVMGIPDSGDTGMEQLIKRLLRLYCNERVSRDMHRVIRILEAEKREKHREELLKKLKVAKERQMGWQEE